MLSIQEKRKQKTRMAIKNAALNIADKDGWHSVTIRKIADEILYTPPVVYEHFQSKNDLFNHLVSDGFNQLYTETMSKVDKSNDPREKLLIMAESRFDFAHENDTLHKMMFNANNPDWGKREILKAMMGIKEMVFSCIESLSPKKDKNEDYLLNLISLIYGFTFLSKNMVSSNKDIPYFKNIDMKRFKNIYLESVDRLISSIKQGQ